MGILKHMRVFGCGHQFSWPRQSADGQAYQVCLVCGAEYLYDWTSMRRRGRMSNPKKPAVPWRKAWVPRARRLMVETCARFRQIGVNGEWSHGTIRNISSSGLLLEAEQLFRLESELEVVFSFPRELSGMLAVGDTVAAHGRVVRVHPEQHLLGVAVFDWAASAYRPLL